MRQALVLLAFLACSAVWGFRQRQFGRPMRLGALGATKTTAVIIVDHGSRRAEANDMLLTTALAYKRSSKVEIVEAAHMEMASPSIADAYRRCVEQGAAHIICHPFFLSPGRHVQEDIPALMREASLQFPDVTYSITEPLGIQNGIVELISQSIDRCLPPQQ